MAPMHQCFVGRAQYADCLPVPGLLFPISVYPKDIVDTEDFVEYPVDSPPFSSLASCFFSHFSATGLF